MASTAYSINKCYNIDPHVEKNIEPLMQKIRNMALRRGNRCFADIAELLSCGRTRPDAPKLPAASVENSSLTAAALSSKVQESNAILNSLQQYQEQRLERQRLMYRSSNTLGSSGRWMDEKSLRKKDNSLDLRNKELMNTTNYILRIVPFIQNLDMKEVKHTPEAFKLKIEEFGIVLNKKEIMDMLLPAFKDSIGYIISSLFFEHLRYTLNDMRLRIIVRSFCKCMGYNTDMMDINEDFYVTLGETDKLPNNLVNGFTTVADILSSFHPEKYPFVISGNITVDSLAHILTEAFAPSNYNPAMLKNYFVTWDEFRSYFAAVSCSFPTDEKFISMMMDVWDLHKKPPPPTVGRCFYPARTIIESKNNRAFGDLAVPGNHQVANGVAGKEIYMDDVTNLVNIHTGGMDQYNGIHRPEYDLSTVQGPPDPVTVNSKILHESTLINKSGLTGYGSSQKDTSASVSGGPDGGNATISSAYGIGATMVCGSGSPGMPRIVRCLGAMNKGDPDNYDNLGVCPSNSGSLKVVLGNPPNTFRSDNLEPPKKIVGYTGHFPGQLDNFGDNFYRTQQRSGKIVADIKTNSQIFFNQEDAEKLGYYNGSMKNITQVDKSIFMKDEDNYRRLREEKQKQYSEAAPHSPLSSQGESNDACIKNSKWMKTDLKTQQKNREPLIVPNKTERNKTHFKLA